MLQPIFGHQATKTRPKIKPLVKWIGGKRKLAPLIAQRLPIRIEGTYYEPFAGGAALLCDLYNAGKITGPIVLADHNAELMDLYRQVRDDPRGLVAELRGYDERYKSGDVKKTEALYYTERDKWNAGGRKPSRFVFLKQTAFNGLWRVNRKNELNAAWGKYKDPSLVDEENIEAWSFALRRAELRVGDSLVWPQNQQPKSGDVVYLDPPYMETFTGYTDEGFSVDKHERLLRLASDWHKSGSVVAYSNSIASKTHVQNLWPAAKIEIVTTTYSVNRDSKNRSGQQELLAFC